MACMLIQSCSSQDAKKNSHLQKFLSVKVSTLKVRVCTVKK